MDVLRTKTRENILVVLVGGECNVNGVIRVHLTGKRKLVQTPEESER
jgi:hypothetical protein